MQEVHQTTTSCRSLQLEAESIYETRSSQGREFSIDPLTYVFALDQSYISSDKKDKKTGKITVEIKKSFRQLCEAFGGPFRTVVLGQKTPLIPKDFASKSLIDELAQCVLSYQLRRMSSICESDPQLRDFSSEASPSLVFSPYFYIPGANEALSGAWEALCVDAIDAFGKLASDVPKHAVLCFSRRLLKDPDRLLSILKRAIESGCDACWFWVSDFREEDITSMEMATLINMVRLAAQTDFPLYNLHGGFLSALMSKLGLYGFSHSIGYGESKDVFPVSGGALPTVSFHYNPLHVKSSVPDIERAFSTLGITSAPLFHEYVCNCSICVGTLKGNIRNFRKYGELVLKPGNTRESQTAESAKRCRFHFLLARKKELELVNQTSPEVLRGMLEAVVKEYEQLPPSMKLRDRSHPLKSWIAVL
jgi:hypothetical protein